MSRKSWGIVLWIMLLGKILANYITEDVTVIDALIDGKPRAVVTAVFLIVTVALIREHFFRKSQDE